MKVLLAIYLTGIIYIILNQKVRKTKHKGLKRAGYVIGYTIPIIFWPLYSIMILIMVILGITIQKNKK